MCKVFDCIRNLRDVVFDEELRPMICAIVKLRCGDVAEITYETASEEADEAKNIVVLLCFVNGRESLVD